MLLQRLKKARIKVKQKCQKLVLMFRRKPCHRRNIFRACSDIKIKFSPVTPYIIPVIFHIPWRSFKVVISNVHGFSYEHLDLVNCCSALMLFTLADIFFQDWSDVDDVKKVRKPKTMSQWGIKHLLIRAIPIKLLMKLTKKLQKK